MPRADRASQFMPFSALKGFEEALREKERLIPEGIPYKNRDLIKRENIADGDNPIDDLMDIDSGDFVMSRVIDEVDVISEHKADGSIIPLRLRFMNDDGEYETYTIKAYRESEKKGTHTTEDGIFVGDYTFVFECLIVVMNMKRVIRLYYDPKSNTKWRLAV
ncbi:hypothetical protein [Butyrivibrio sp. INlla16]|uniref:hypothetical protein n=1 Tax=Butyrivibrio sp. INlla16 TaxID=1520807 RepID=UPI00088E260E|nr:hypothetical protein [Butyrivibrio sp. INlla16]SDB26304.1 hypothetical protein SAMN02910263_01248 [Butyrivibrio sp. INlla16]